MSDIRPLAEEARAADARARLTGSIGALKARLAPKTLAKSALHRVVDKSEEVALAGFETAQRHPAGVAGAVAAIGLFFARKPIARLLFRRDATVTPPESSNPHNRAAKRNAE